MRTEAATPRRRSPLAVACTALLFGSLLCPYMYIATGALSGFSGRSILVILPALVVSTLVLLAASTRETRIERAARTGLRGLFPFLFAGVIALCLAVSYRLLGAIAHFTLFTSVEYWFYLAALLSASSAIALLVISFAPSSRLERALDARFCGSNASSTYLRAFAYLFLLLVVAALCAAGYAFWTAPPPRPI